MLSSYSATASATYSPRIALPRVKEGKKMYEHTFEEKYDPCSWYNIKRRYSMYFLPELIIEEIIKRSGEKERQKLESILSSIEGKPEVFKNADERFKNQFNRIKRLIPKNK